MSNKLTAEQLAIFTKMAESSVESLNQDADAV